MNQARGATVRKPRRKGKFDAQAFLDSAGVDKKIVEFGVREIIFRQGDLCDQVFYIQKGGVKLSVLNHLGKEAVIAVLGRGEFFGEGCLLGLPLRMATASAITHCTVLAIKKDEMLRELHAEQALAGRFLSSCCLEVSAWRRIWWISSLTPSKNDWRVPSYCSLAMASRTSRKS